MENDYDYDFNQPAHQALMALRERAEQRRHLVTQVVRDKTPDEVERLVQELQTHQIELELQFEELMLAQAEAEEARAELTSLYDFAPVGYLTLDASGVIRQLNLCAAQQLGSIRQRLLGRRLALFVAEADRPRCIDFLRHLHQYLYHSDDRHTCELAMRKQDGTPWVALLEVRQVLTPDQEPQCRIVLVDVTARRAAAEALAQSEARFRHLFEFSADAVLLARDMHVVDCNAAALRLMEAADKSQLIGQMMSTMAPELQPDGTRSDELARQHHATLLRQGAHRFEWFHHTLQGRGMWMEVTLTAIDMNGEQLVHNVWRDITAQRAARELLRTEKEFTENLLDNSVDAIVALDRAGCITAWNRTAESYSGLTEASVLGQDIFALFPHLDTPEGRATLQQVLQHGEPATLGNVPFLKRDGHFDAYIVPLRGGQYETIPGVLVVIRDVTERNRLVEEATRLRLTQQQEVLSAILSTQEAERKRIAEALHNGVGQLLYATKLHLERSTDTKSSKSVVLLDEAIKMTRSISFELTPGILEDFGLKYALEELVRRIPRASLKASVHTSGLEAPLPTLLEVAVYRMVQELFNNIIKHASAQEAFIHVVREADQLSISVEDNGQGFDAGLQPGALPGIGLPGIHNRVRLLGGTLSIASRPGQGTIISIELSVR